MSRFVLSMALITTLAACGSDVESSEGPEGVPVDAAAPSQAPVVNAQPARSIPAGTVLTFEVRETVSTSSHTSGDEFALVLVDGVTGTGGASLGAGAAARGVITNAHRSTGSDDEALLAVRINSVEAGGTQQPIGGVVQSTAIESSDRDSGTTTAAKIATGTAAGAIIGQILGQNTRSTVQGAAAGTVVGVVVALSTLGGDATLPSGSMIVVRLDRSLVF